MRVSNTTRYLKEALIQAGLLKETLEVRGRLLPGYVQRESEEFLSSDRLEHGFPRAGFEQCQHERLVAFSCKRRGL